MKTQRRALRVYESRTLKILLESARREEEEGNVAQSRCGTWILLHDAEGFDGGSSQHGRQGGREAVTLTREPLKHRRAFVTADLMSSCRFWLHFVLDADRCQKISFINLSMPLTAPLQSFVKVCFSPLGFIQTRFLCCDFHLEIQTVFRFSANSTNPISSKGVS